MDADREKNLTLTRWFKFSFWSSSFYIPLRSKGNIIDVFLVFKYPALYALYALREFLSGNVWLSKKVSCVFTAVEKSDESGHWIPIIFDNTESLFLRYLNKKTSWQLFNKTCLVYDARKNNQGFISLFQVNSSNNYALQVINYHYLWPAFGRYGLTIWGILFHVLRNSTVSYQKF